MNASQWRSERNNLTTEQLRDSARTTTDSRHGPKSSDGEKNENLTKENFLAKIPTAT